MRTVRLCVIFVVVAFHALIMSISAHHHHHHLLPASPSALVLRPFWRLPFRMFRGEPVRGPQPSRHLRQLRHGLPDALPRVHRRQLERDHEGDWLGLNPSGFEARWKMAAWAKRTLPDRTQSERGDGRGRRDNWLAGLRSFAPPVGGEWKHNVMHVEAST